MYEPSWHKVIYAGDCRLCEWCDEPVCPKCNIHYWECKCPGPHQSDEYDYKWIEGDLYAREKL